MFNLQLLDVAIGMAFVYLAMSLICSGINEWIAQLRDSRARYLQAWLAEVLKGTNWKTEPLEETFKGHPLITALAPKDKRPSYILPHTFLLALLDAVAPVNEATAQRSLDEIRRGVIALSDSDFRRTLLALIDSAGDNLEKVRQNIEDWFSDAMERLSGEYKRRSRSVILLLALVVTVGLNVSSFRLFSTLYRDSAVRAAVVATAERAAQQTDTSGQAPALPDVQRIQDELQALNLPIGWTDPALIPAPTDVAGWALLVLGWLITAMAVSQGAPFWFDTLNKLVNVRTTGARPPTTPNAPPTETRVVVQMPAGPGSTPNGATPITGATGEAAGKV